jgi:IS5 family transposase
MAGQLLRFDDKIVFADTVYMVAAKRPENDGKDVDWQVARKRGQVKKLREGVVKGLTQYAERMKDSVMARMEHPFHIAKNLFGERKTRYHGVAKNES